MSVVIWVMPGDCDPPHGLDLTTARDADKVNMLVDAFIRKNGFDTSYPALIGYPRDGRIQLLSGTHRHTAAGITNHKLPVVIWPRYHIEEAWGELEDWKRVMEDIPVCVLEKWTREDIEAHAVKYKSLPA